MKTREEIVDKIQSLILEMNGYTDELLRCFSEKRLNELRWVLDGDVKRKECPDCRYYDLEGCDSYEVCPDWELRDQDSWETQLRSKIAAAHTAMTNRKQANFQQCVTEIVMNLLDRINDPAVGQMLYWDWTKIKGKGTSNEKYSRKALELLQEKFKAEWNDDGKIIIIHLDEQE